MCNNVQYLIPISISHMSNLVAKLYSFSRADRQDILYMNWAVQISRAIQENVPVEVIGPNYSNILQQGLFSAT